MNEPRRDRAKFLTANEGSIILDPAWDGGGFKLTQVVFGESVSPRRVGVFFRLVSGRCAPSAPG